MFFFFFFFISKEKGGEEKRKRKKKEKKRKKKEKTNPFLLRKLNQHLQGNNLPCGLIYCLVYPSVGITRLAWAEKRGRKDQGERVSREKRKGKKKGKKREEKGKKKKKGERKGREVKKKNKHATRKFLLQSVQ